MRDIPVVLTGYKLTVVEPPAPKTRDDGTGNPVVVTDRDGVTQFVVSLFAKLRVQPGQRAPTAAPAWRCFGSRQTVWCTPRPGSLLPRA